MKNRRLTLLLSVFAIALSLSGCKDKSDNSYDVMYEHMTYCWAQSLAGQHFDNAFYGDSRVIGGSFVSEFADKSCVNLGVGGDKVSHLIKRFSLIEAVTPNRVFLAIGGNDALSDKFNSDTFTSEYRTLLTKFKDKSIDVIVNSVPGITTANSSFKEKDVKRANNNISTVNQIVKNLASEFSYTLVDVAIKMNKEGTNELKAEYATDGVHFTEEGYRVWFDTISSFVI